MSRSLRSLANYDLFFCFFTFWGDEGVVLFEYSGVVISGGGMGLFVLYFCIVDHTRMRTSEGVQLVSGLCRTSGGMINEGFGWQNFDCRHIVFISVHSLLLAFTAAGFCDLLL